MNPTELATIVILATAILVVAMFVAVSTFGHITERRIASNEKTRIVCEQTAESVRDTERRIAEREGNQIELLREMMKADTYRRA